MKQTSTTFSAIVSLVLLCGPLVLSPFLFARNRSFITEVENREVEAFPEIDSLGDILKTQKWNGLSAWLQERVPFRGDAITAKSWVEMDLLGQRRVGRVDRADDGWLFLRGSYGMHWEEPGKHGSDGVDALDAFIRRHTDSKATFRMLLTPDKHTVYPEYLTEAGRRDVAVTADDRALLEGRFAIEGDPNVVDVHGAMLKAKSQGGKELYFRDDTHQNWHGGCIMARSIIDSMLPGAWNDDHVLQAQIFEQEGDLRKMLGMPVEKLRERELLVISRPGVRASQIHFEGESHEDFSGIDGNEHAWRLPLRIQYESSESLPLVPGRTLLLHDSCIGSIARPLLRPFFSDITFKHYMNATPETIEQAMHEYDHVILEVVERVSPATMVELLAEPALLPE